MRDQEKTLLILLERETQKQFELLTDACDIVRDQNVSNYPIIFAAIQPIELGIDLPQLSRATDWIYRMTTLEELVAKQLVEMGKVDNFRVLYKQRKEQLCVFAVYEDQTQFIFVPMKSEL